MENLVFLLLWKRTQEYVPFASFLSRAQMDHPLLSSSPLEIFLVHVAESLYVFKCTVLNIRECFTLCKDFWMNAVWFVSDVQAFIIWTSLQTAILFVNYYQVTWIWHLNSVFVPQFRKILSMSWCLMHLSLWFAWRLLFCAQDPLF